MNYEDRVTKEYVENALANAGAKIVVGSYVGTGEYGAEHPTSITFDFTPKLFFLFEDDTASESGTKHAAVVLWGWTSQLSYKSGSNQLSYDGNTIRWYSTSSASVQINNLGSTYHYAAIG